MATQMTDQTILDLMGEFGDAFNRHDVDAIMACMAEDCIFISRHGERLHGSDKVRAHFTKRLAEVPDLHFEQTDHFFCDNRGFYEWKVTFKDHGTPMEIVSCDIFTYRDGKIAVKDYYVKWPSG